VTRQAGCELCERSESPAWHVVVAGAKLRVVRVLDAPGFPAFYRVIWGDHVREWSDLGAADRERCMAAVVGVENALKRTLSPAKINLASLGNLVPHVHWHVIARFTWDSHFPQPIWASAQRAADAAALAQVGARLAQVDAAVRDATIALVD
jgi:diadenosine tetraphosphate (Ap4A) HIT family hydrolase